MFQTATPSLTILFSELWKFPSNITYRLYLPSIHMSCATFSWLVVQPGRYLLKQYRYQHQKSQYHYHKSLAPAIKEE